MSHSLPGTTLEWESSPRCPRIPVPLLGKAEKSQLEQLIIAALNKHYDSKGAHALLNERARVVVDPTGVTVDEGEIQDPLAAVPLRTLFTTLCYVSAGAPTVPRDALESLATEATSAAAAQINRIAAD